jgi:hypothetical protein
LFTTASVEGEDSSSALSSSPRRSTSSFLRLSYSEIAIVWYDNDCIWRRRRGVPPAEQFWNWNRRLHIRRTSLTSTCAALTSARLTCSVLETV